jgi:hypothetical protein
MKPEDKPKQQLRGPQEENPQVIPTVQRNDGTNVNDDKLPPSAFAEPSEPAHIAPRDKEADQIARPQEENPQVVVTTGRENAREKAKTEEKVKGKAKL